MYTQNYCIIFKAAVQANFLTNPQAVIFVPIFRPFFPHGQNGTPIPNTTPRRITQWQDPKKEHVKNI